MRVTSEEAIPEYGLDYEVVGSSTPTMLSEVERAVDREEPIVFTAWKQHWMFTAYGIRYLEDPKGAMGEAEQLSAMPARGSKRTPPRRSSCWTTSR